MELGTESEESHVVVPKWKKTPKKGGVNQARSRELKRLVPLMPSTWAEPLQHAQHGHEDPRPPRHPFVCIIRLHFFHSSHPLKSRTLKACRTSFPLRRRILILIWPSPHPPPLVNQRHPPTPHSSPTSCRSIVPFTSCRRLTQRASLTQRRPGSASRCWRRLRQQVFFLAIFM